MVAGMGRGSVTAVTSFRSSLFFSVTLQLTEMKYGGAGGGEKSLLFKCQGLSLKVGRGFSPTIPSIRGEDSVVCSADNDLSE